MRNAKGKRKGKKGDKSVEGGKLVQKEERIQSVM